MGELILQRIHFGHERARARFGLEPCDRLVMQRSGVLIALLPDLELRRLEHRPPLREAAEQLREFVSAAAQLAHRGAQQPEQRQRDRLLLRLRAEVRRVRAAAAAAAAAEERRLRDRLGRLRGRGFCHPDAHGTIGARAPHLAGRRRAQREQWRARQPARACIRPAELRRGCGRCALALPQRDAAQLAATGPELPAAADDVDAADRVHRRRGAREARAQPRVAVEHEHAVAPRRRAYEGAVDRGSELAHVRVELDRLRRWRRARGGPAVLGARRRPLRLPHTQRLVGIHAPDAAALALAVAGAVRRPHRQHRAKGGAAARDGTQALGSARIPQAHRAVLAARQHDRRAHRRRRRRRAGRAQARDRSAVAAKRRAQAEVTAPEHGDAPIRHPSPHDEIATESLCRTLAFRRGPASQRVGRPHGLDDR